MKKVLFYFFCTALFLLLPSKISSEGNEARCDNRYVTLINPVRGRNLWSDKSLAPIIDQYQASAKYNFPVTWLMQYDAITDDDLAATVKNFDNNSEKGIFLEISKQLADDAGVKYINEIRWSHPGSVFLSAYSQTERRKLIDVNFNKFKTVFGYYPKSVGAWWIDSYSINYIKNKYGLISIMIVADQKSTDSYGVWGQWWGYPYIPSISNLLVPAKDKGLGAVVVQWAQRDPLLAYGDGPGHSNYSLQANDYIRSGKNTWYFKSLAETYLDCTNELGQITVGLETGMEATEFQNEYENQLEVLSQIPDLNFVTMSDFALMYLKLYGNRNPTTVSIGDWRMDVSGRANPKVDEYIYYPTKIASKDYFISDKSGFLDRDINTILAQNSGRFNIALMLLLILSFWFYFKLGKLNLWLSSLFFSLSSFALIFKSNEVYGWNVYYALILKNLYLDQIIIFILAFGFIFLVYRKMYLKVKNINLFLILLPLSFAVDGFVALIRATKLSGAYFFGLLTAENNIAGIAIRERSIEFIKNINSPVSLSYFYKFPFEKIYSNGFRYLLLYPLVHILVSLTLYFLIYKRSQKIKFILILLLTVFYGVFINLILKSDPVYVSAIIK